MSAGTIQTQINITTNENATCRYNTTNSSFENSTNFSTTGAMTHLMLFSGLTNGNTYNLYYWCNDTVGNINVNVTHHKFSIAPTPAKANPSPKDPPVSDEPTPVPVIENDTINETIIIDLNDTERNTTIDDEILITQAFDVLERIRKKISENISDIKNYVEIKELLDQAERAYDSGDYITAYNLAKRADEIIKQITLTTKAVNIETKNSSIYQYTFFAFILLILAIVVKRITFSKKNILNINRTKEKQITPMLKSSMESKSNDVSIPQVQIKNNSIFMDSIENEPHLQKIIEIPTSQSISKSSMHVDSKCSNLSSFERINDELDEIDTKLVTLIKNLGGRINK